MSSKIKEKLHELADNLKKSADDDNEKAIWDKALDIVELLVTTTPTKIDDFFILPIIRILRRRLDIPNN